MTKLIRYIKAFTTMVLLAVSLIAPTSIFGDFTAASEPLKENCKLYFASISDIHMSDETARRDMLGFGLLDMQESKRKFDALVCAGDLTNHGSEEEWEMLKESFSLYSPANKIILAQGNHDTWTQDKKYDLAKKFFIKYNNEISGRKTKTEYYSTKVKGYTFIVLASEKRGTSAYMSNKQLTWLKNELKKAAKSDKPIFVVCHWPLNQTHGLPVTWGDDDMEIDDGGIGDQSAKVEKLLKKYDNVFMINGHIHSGFSNEKDSKRTGYVSVESHGSFHSINLPSYMYVGTQGKIANGTGFVFEVYKDEVIVRSRSFSAGVWYTNYVYNIPLV